MALNRCAVCVSWVAAWRRYRLRISDLFNECTRFRFASFPQASELAGGTRLSGGEENVARQQVFVVG